MKLDVEKWLFFGLIDLGDANVDTVYIQKLSVIQRYNHFGYEGRDFRKQFKDRFLRKRYIRRI